MPIIDNLEDLHTDLEGLGTEQLHDLKDAIEEELDYLEEYSDCWGEFYVKYKNSLDSLEMLSRIKSNQSTTLHKLGERVFLQGKMTRPKKVLVYLGDNYYAKMSIEDAKTFFIRKTESLLEDYEAYDEGNDRKYAVYRLIQDILANKIRKKFDNSYDKTLSKRENIQNENPVTSSE